ncbi:MAG TPA: hypothetical protein VFJ13_02860, partial [Paracoccaceae bacterium]|nr:hypothetical protein [Paracoccaceae bacterium]
MQKRLRFINRWLPRGLFGRALLILVLPIVLLQVVVALVLLERLYDEVTEQMAEAVALELQFAIDAVESAPTIPVAERALRRMSGPLDFELALQPGATVEQAFVIGFFDLTGREIAKQLRAVNRPIFADFVSYDKYVAASIATEKGVLSALIPRRRMNAR